MSDDINNFQIYNGLIVEGRVLNPPTLKYKSGTAQIRQGTWNPLNFIAPKNLGQWAIMHLSGRGGDQRTQNDVHRFVQNMQQVNL